ncbi:MAG: peptidoglycan DD-metalloendopeptidase family protein [Thermoleophilia bacterium]|nr:peptidoglycan DD-metalloendopeptidase family protein [Thermoleophilia bacterium]
MAAAEAREQKLTSDIESVSGEILTLEREVGDVSQKLRALERDLELHRRKLARLQKLLEIQTARLEYLRAQYRTALERLSRRLVGIYQHDTPDTIDVVMSSSSFSDIVDGLDLIREIGRQDAHVSGQVKAARDQLRLVRARTARTKERVDAATRVIAIRTAQQRALHLRLVARKSGLLRARGFKQASLEAVEKAHHGYESEAHALQAVSEKLAAQIRAAQAAAAQRFSPTAAAATDAPSASGFVWPVSGPVVSVFGWRWGRMHEGIDIAAGYGTPIRAAASGGVVSTGWLGGYGNLVVIDHGGGLATAYAHLSSFATGGGSVSQGQVIGYVGCTGHCFGPHLHFEVRVNGAAVDPLGYL